MTIHGSGSIINCNGARTLADIISIKVQHTGAGVINACRQSQVSARLPATLVMASIVLFAMMTVVDVALYNEADAQEEQLRGETASQKSISITIGTGADGLDMHVRHILNPSDTKTILRLVDSGSLSGKINIISSSMADTTTIAEPADQMAQINGTLVPETNGTITVIPPLDAEAAVEYVITDAISTSAGGIHTVQYTYPHTTLVIIPKDTETVFVNGRLIDLGSKQKIACHGCSMTLEYAVKTAPNNGGDKTYYAQIKNDVSFPIHVASRPDTSGLEFNVTSGEIMLHTDSAAGPQFVTMTIPAQMMTGPFTVSLDEQKILYQDSANDTHSTIVMRLESGGIITVEGMLAESIIAYQQQQQQQQQQHAEQAQDDIGISDDNDMWMSNVMVVAGTVIVAIAAVIITYRTRINRQKSRTSKTHTRQSG